MLTPTVDPGSFLNTGFAHKWVEALGHRVERLDVLCRSAGEIDLPPDITVTSMDSMHHSSRFGLLPAFHRAVKNRIREVDIVFSHLAPRYALAAKPNAFLHRVPIVHWDANGIIDVHWQKRLAHMLVDRIVTATSDSYCFSGPKVTVIGHGIDFNQFAPSDSPVSQGRIILAVGLLAPCKNYELQIEAAALLLKQPGFEDVTFKVAGDAGWWNQSYHTQLEACVARHNLTGRFQFMGGVPYAEIPSLYKSATMTLSTSQTGGLDKVVLEAVGCGLPAVVTGPVYTQLLDEDRGLLLAREGDPQDIANRLSRVLNMDPTEQRTLGLRLRNHAMAAHSLDRMIDRLIEVFRGEIARRGKR